MPEIARFFGIIIRMYIEPGAPHNRPHFHAYYQNDMAVYSIDNVEILAGSLPAKQKRLVEAWAEIHRIELMSNWNRLQNGQMSSKIQPLQ